MKLKFIAALLALACSLHPAVSQGVPAGSPGFFQGNSTAAVTFDANSLFIDGQRVMIFSGEFHPWRLPVPQLWSDVLQKMKAAGFNAASVYFNWALVEGTPGSLDWNYFRSLTDFYEVAKRVGIFIICRPGPYINGETAGGGFPGWLTNVNATARTNATLFTNAWNAYMTQFAQQTAPYQYPDGPVIAVQSENEFDTQTLHRPYMILLENNLRANGITKVPLTHNDKNAGGQYSGGAGAVDLYGFDGYPNGFNCAKKTTWGKPSLSYATSHFKYSPNVPLYFPEFQGGSDDTINGAGYDNCYTMTNEDFANVFYKNNYASHVTLHSLYMTYGGTNWGNLATSTVYSSYDYGAPIREDRTLSAKYTELKLQALFLHASPSYLTAKEVSNTTGGAVYTTNTAIYGTNLKSPDNDTNYYVVMQTDDTNLSNVTFSMNVDTNAGTLTIPQYGGAITLAGRESKIIVTNYAFGQSVLQYSTAEVMTWTTIDDIDVIVLYALAGQQTETVVQSTATNVTLTQSSSAISSNVVNGTVVLSGSPNGISVAQFGRVKVIVMDKATAGTLWNPRLTASTYDLSPRQSSVLIGGPYLVRNATISGSTISIFGDIKATGTLSVVAPASVNTVLFNGATVSGTTDAAGVFSGSVSDSIGTVTVPTLTTAAWSCADTLPEVATSFDDSTWVVANKTETHRPFQPTAGKYVLYGDEYGFHQGNLVLRGRFTGSATGVTLNVQGGVYFGYSAFLNGEFLGSSQGKNIDSTTNTFNFSATNAGDNVVTVVVDNTGLDEDYTSTDSFKNPRGIRGYQLLGGGDFTTWKIAGNLGGESWPDKVRGPMNEGGLWFERVGAHLPGNDASSWTANCTPYTGITAAGIRAYRTSFDLDFPANADVPLSLRFTRTTTSNYRSVFYINGWQFGRFFSNYGPQTVFPIPEGILNHRGTNVLIVTIWSLDAAGAKIAAMDLASSAIIDSSKEIVTPVLSPTFAQLR